MPFYAVDPGSLSVRTANERTPAICLMAEGGAESEIPEPLRAAADFVTAADQSCFRDGHVPEGCDAALLWMSGEQVLSGSGASIRELATHTAGRALVPIQLNGFGPDELGLIVLQPRVWKKGSSGDCVQQEMRFASPAPHSPGFREYVRECPEVWARISRAAQAGKKHPENGIERLSKLWRNSPIIPPVLGALLVRNLIVLHIQINQAQRIEPLLQAGMDRYPRYAELPFIAAWIALQNGNLQEASRFASRALENPDPSFVGSGGERSYRSAYLGGAAAERMGNQGLAVRNYLAGLSDHLAFPPSVHALLRQRVDAAMAELLSVTTLPALVRREPHYTKEVVDFLLLHRRIGAARRILTLSRIEDDLRQKLQDNLDEAVSSQRPAARLAGAKPGVTLTGPFFVHSSLARINRELAAAMIASTSIQTALEPYEMSDAAANVFPRSEAIAKGLANRISRLDLTVRLHWPPDFTAPPSGKLVSILPWEFSAIPAYWVKPIQENVAELWAISQFSKDAFVRAGVQEDRVHVIPPGVDVTTFTPEGPAWRPDGCRGFVFLFVGGAILRKGPDVLWNAYQAAFTASDDVSLVIKETGADSFYQGQSLAPRIRAAAAAKPGGPHVIIVGETLDDARLAALYRGCDVFILPYRAEGFGMPLAEAIACGKRVITTGSGPSREFCPPEVTDFIPAAVEEIESYQHLLGPMSGPFSWFEPDVNELAKTMRRAYDHRASRAGCRSEASRKIHSALGWSRITKTMLSRIQRLVNG